MLGTLNPGEEAQLRQTIEMFEVITQSQPQDYQSLEILKEAYLKLSMEKEVILTSKRIAQAYVQLGQLSSAILEYEIILQRYPDDKDALAAMQQIESKANNLTKMPEMESASAAAARTGSTTLTKKESGHPSARLEVDDGRQSMHKLFVESKLISAGEFDLCWPSPSLTDAPKKVVEPFLHNLAEKGIVPLEKSMKLLLDRTRMAYIPLERYEIEMDLGRAFPREVCLRWCVLPFDRLSKSVMVATANPFNKQTVSEMEQATKSRLLWYLATPVDLMRMIGKVYR